MDPVDQEARHHELQDELAAKVLRERAAYHREAIRNDPSMLREFFIEIMGNQSDEFLESMQDIFYKNLTISAGYEISRVYNDWVVDQAESRARNEK